jgi:hypothetical protein
LSGARCPTSSDDACDVTHVKFEGDTDMKVEGDVCVKGEVDIDIKEEEGINMKEEEDIGLKVENSAVDVTIANMEAEKHEVS